MKSFFKLIAVIVAIFISVSGLLIYLNPIIYEHLWTDYQRHVIIQKPLEEPVNNIDGIVFGDSRSMFGVDSKLLSFNNYIFYNLSSVGQSVDESFYYYDLATSIDNVKVIVQCASIETLDLESRPIRWEKAESMILSGYTLSPTTDSLIANNISPLFYDNEYLTILKSTGSLFRKILHNNFFRPLIDKEMFIKDAFLDLYHPYPYLNNRHHTYPNNIHKGHRDISISNYTIELVSKLVTLCEMRNKLFMIVLMPVNPEVSEINKEKHSKIIEELKSVPDLYIVDLTLSLNSSDFYDAIHPNRQGASKVSKLIKEKLIDMNLQDKSL